MRTSDPPHLCHIEINRLYEVEKSQTLCFMHSLSKIGCTVLIGHFVSMTLICLYVSDCQVKITDPLSGKPARRETSTMPQWAGSCW